MKTFIAILLALVLVAQAVELREHEFMSWRLEHGKFYNDELEHAFRLKVFSKNMDFAEKYNAENSAVIGGNKFADLTPEEYRNTYLVEKKHMAALMSESTSTHVSTGVAPASVDWTTKGAVTAVKDQGQCGSCWSFSTTGSLEGMWQIAGNKLVSLSEKNLMDCTWDKGNMGCNGGMPVRAMSYVKKHGIVSEDDYPYVPKSSYTCKSEGLTIATEMTSDVSIKVGSEEDLMNAVATHGPISVAIDASHTSFQLYHDGIYVEESCKNGANDLDHAVLVVGYGTNEQGDYWKVKNSWNTSWGMDGYILMARNHNNMCGIASSAVYPLDN